MNNGAELMIHAAAFISLEKDSHQPILSQIYCFDFVHLLHNVLNLNKFFFF